VKSVLCAVAAVALAGSLAACGGSDKPAASASTSTSAPTPAASSAPATPTAAAMEQAFVLEAMGAMPELALARPELVKLGYTTCQAFRDKPGSVQFLVDNMTKAGQPADQIKTAKVVAVAAIHNLCTDQAGDL
jgi:hypothetical protein